MRRWFFFGPSPFLLPSRSLVSRLSLPVVGGVVLVSCVLAFLLSSFSGLAPFGCLAALCFGRVSGVSALRFSLRVLFIWAVALLIYFGVGLCMFQ